MAILIFQSAAARTRIIASYPLVRNNRSFDFLLTIGDKVIAVSLKPGLVRPCLNSTPRLFPKRDKCSEQE